MRTEQEIKQKGMEVLLNELGDVDTEIFIKGLIREPFDYTRWQQDLWANKNVNEINERAVEYQKKKQEE